MKTTLRRLISILILSACVAGTAFPDDAAELLRSAPSSSQYPNAGYVNLIDECWHTVREDGSWASRTRMTQKICNERGRSAANVHLAFNSAFETIRIIRARTIKKDGAVVEVKPADIQEVTPYSGYAMYSSIKAKVLIMPAVEDDCVIDYEWEISGKSTIMSPHFWSRWYFQSSEPTVLSRFTLTTPTDMGFGSQAYSMEIKPAVTTSKDGMAKTYVWEGRDFSEIEPEPNMPPASEICPWFEVSSVTAWDDVADWYWNLVEPKMKPVPEIEQKVAVLIEGRETDEEKARAIYYCVEDNIRYVALAFGASAYEPHSAADVFANKYGDCKDQATLLVTMLRHAGIKAYPVLLSVSYRGSMDRRLPSPGQFDHAIVLAEIGGKRYWLDPTAEVCPFGDLPDQDRGRDVLVIRDGKGEFIQTPSYDVLTNSVAEHVNIRIDAKGGISASVSIATVGGADLATRATYKYLKPSRIKETFEAMVAGISPNAHLGEHSVSDYSDRDSRMTISYDLQADNWATRTGKFLMFKPGLNQNPAGQTPFSKASRKYDLWFTGAQSSISDTVISLPEGFAVEEMPQDQVLASDFAGYERRCVLEGLTLRVTEKTVRQSAIVPVARYAEVRKFYEDIIQSQKQLVILKQL